MNKSSQSGFTIIETLVAITILMIAITGPLTVANKGLTAAVFARDQMIASYLAQDAMEYLKNLRDFNKLNTGSAWTSGFDYCNSAIPCIVDTTDTNVVTLGGQKTQISPLNSCVVMENNCGRLFIDDTNGYSYDSSKTPTQFYRYFYVTQNAINSGDAKLSVIVRWNTATVSNSVTLNSELFDTFR